MIGVFGFIIVNNSLYTHSHVSAFGQVFTHAHPFDKSDGEGDPKSHRHTKAEIILLDQVNLLFVCILVIILLGASFNGVRLNQRILVDFSPVYLCHQKGRSPPSLLYQSYFLFKGL